MNNRKMAMIVFAVVWSAPHAVYAENLHLRQGGNWDCGYITYTDPNYLICKRCEDRDMHFETSGSSGYCIEKDNGGSIKNRLRRRLLEEQVNESDEGDEDDNSNYETKLPTPPDYGRSGISIDGSSNLRSDATLAGQLQRVQRTVSPIITLMKNNNYYDSYEKLKTDRLRAAISRGHARTKAHLELLATFTYAEGLRRQTEFLDALLKTEKRKLYLHAFGQTTKSWLEAMQDNKSIFFSDFKPATQGDHTFKALINKTKDMRSSAFSRYYAASVTNDVITERTSLRDSQSKCKEYGGVFKKDLITGFSNTPFWACHVKPISKEEVTALIREYEEHLQAGIASAD